MTLGVISNLNDSILLYPWWSQHFIPFFRYLKCFEDVCVLFVVMHFINSRVEDRIYWDAVALSSIRDEILIANDFTVVQTKFK